MLKIKKTANLDQDLYKDAVAIREQVFVNEQGIPIELEMTGEEGPCYYVGYVDENPVVTARVIQNPTEWVIQRVAVIADQRNKRYGSEVMAAIEKDALANQILKLTLHAQSSSQPFYLQLGYQVKGKEFKEATLKHHVMVKEL